jgi:hypothetical protein
VVPVTAVLVVPGDLVDLGPTAMRVTRAEQLPGGWLELTGTIGNAPRERRVAVVADRVRIVEEAR